MKKILLLSSVISFINCQNSSQNWPCDHEIFCRPNEGILHTIQMAKLFEDSKEFVDMPLKYSKEEVLNNFDQLSDHEKETLKTFVEENFSAAGTELEEVTPVDWLEDPQFLNDISDENLKQLAAEMNGAWKNLTRKISISKEDAEESSSLIYLEKPFVVPGGRFREIYYWDSFWTIKGLILSEMQETVKGMIENFQYLIKLYGSVPNGNRLYYTRRSQPPMLTQIVWDYIKWTNDLTTEREFIAGIIWDLHEEFQYWESKMVEVKINNETYKLARYWVEADGPRPESYAEDFTNAQKMEESEREEWYQHIKSGAESGWDFSSRWMETIPASEEQEMLEIKTGNIIPVDLNSFLCKNARILSILFNKVENEENASKYDNISRNLKDSIRAVLFDEADQMWYDYNHVTGKHTKRWYPSNLTPLYTGCDHLEIDLNKTVAYVEKMTTGHPGGVPTSLNHTHQQWDKPNSWPPLVDIVVTAMDNTGTTEGKRLAKELSENFVRNVYSTWRDTGKIYEKYNCSGGGGGGGEYETQTGFGWTNGVTMSLLHRYPDMTSSATSELLYSKLIFVLSILVLSFSHAEL